MNCIEWLWHRIVGGTLECCGAEMARGGEPFAIYCATGYYVRAVRDFARNVHPRREGSGSVNRDPVGYVSEFLATRGIGDGWNARSNR